MRRQGRVTRYFLNVDMRVMLALGLDPKRELQRMLSILSTSHIYTEPFNVESKTKGMISGLYQDFLLPKSRARFQTPPSEIVPMHDFVEKCTISCRPS